MLQNYLSEQPAEKLAKAQNTLAVLPFGKLCQPGVAGVINSGLTALGKQNVSEIWSVSQGSVSRGVTGRCHWSEADDVLAVAVWMTATDCQNLQTATESAYTDLLDVITQLGFPYPFRFWNYIPDINKGTGDAEQYKLFCAGRLNAFRKMAVTETHFPAASALGHHTEGALIYVFAAKTPGEHRGNSLQVNAYHYPREYGASSPSFSRATGIILNQQPQFFISGTASIIGHKTTSEGNLQGQLETTVTNIRHLLECHTKENQSEQTMALQSMKIYLRHAEDYADSLALLQDHFPDTVMMFSQADICRKNLLVEVECFCG